MVLKLDKEVFLIKDEYIPLATVNDTFSKNRIFVWRDPKIVSIAVLSRTTTKGGVISFVYTPIEERGKGYASSCVAALSQHILDQGF